MARMLEVLNQAGPKGRPPTEAAVPSSPSLANESAEVEVPFIEVGGPRKMIEASPVVLACAPPAVPARRSASADSSRVHAARPAARPVVLRPVPARAIMAPPRERFASELVAFHRPDDPVSEGYRTLLSGMTATRPARKSQVVALTAAASGVGTTTVLLNLAITAARQGLGRVLLVDANGRRPALAARLGLSAAPGLSDVLGGGASLQEAIQETGQSDLAALTAGKVGPDGSVHLVAEAMPAVLRQLREQASLVFVDLPCWNETREAVLLASACDPIYVVVPQSDAEAPSVQELLQAMPGQGARLGGCLLVQS